MKIKKQKILQYFLIAIIPALIATFFYIEKMTKEEINEQKNNAKWIGTIHQKQWDNFINKTDTSLNI
ncbi:MAG: two-component sensor histidine kinase, partial [Bacillus sp. (in: firmicutes)]